MPSKDTVPFAMTKSTKKEIENWRKKIADALGIELHDVNLRHAEIALRISAQRGSVEHAELQDILLGKIK